jgi:hypothetical protein
MGPLATREDLVTFFRAQLQKLFNSVNSIPSALDLMYKVIDNNINIDEISPTSSLKSDIKCLKTLADTAYSKKMREENLGAILACLDMQEKTLADDWTAKSRPVPLCMA